MKYNTDKSRRRLLKSVAALPFLGSGISMTAAPKTAAAATCSPKSLVCIFLAGGADSFNIFVPGGAAYNDYRTTRNELAVDDNDLISVNDSAQGNFGFNTATGAMARLYQEGRLAVVSNTGPLIRPTTKADYLNETALPQSLFAHNTQQKLWQTGAGQVTGSSSFGWGGAICDHAALCNGNIAVAPGFSTAGNNDWQTASNSDYISLNAALTVEQMLGHANISDWIPPRRQDRMRNVYAAMAQLGSNNSSRFQQELAGTFSRATVATDALHSALRNNPLPQMTYDGKNKLAIQLHMVARLIASRTALQQQQQVFFVLMGGWDTHSDQLQRLPSLYRNLNEGIDAFQNTIDGLGLADTVTSFTASDFGRTLTSNGNGTDHGWGGHNFVFGNAVQGGRVYGQMPSYTKIDNPDDAGNNDASFAGRIIPGTSVHQYGATLSSWMGLDDADMLSIFPDLNNFTTRNLGFMS